LKELGREIKDMKRELSICALLLLVQFALPVAAFAQREAPAGSTIYKQINLASDIPHVAAFTQHALQNPMGITRGVGFFDTFILLGNHTEEAVFLKPSGDSCHEIDCGILSLPVPVMGTDGVTPKHPTGVAFNDVWGNNDGTGIFPYFGGVGEWVVVTDDGTVNCWNLISTPTIDALVDNSKSGAVYKGVAVFRNSGGGFAAVSNFHSGQIEVYDGQNYPQAWTLVHLKGNFTDPKLPTGFAPFGVARVNKTSFVTYAQQDKAKKNPVTGAGLGLVDEFDVNGNFVRRFASRGVLNAPWGMALAPAKGFGQFSGALLIGNFGDGVINAFDLKTGKSLDTLRDAKGKPIANPGLWGMFFGGQKLRDILPGPPIGDPGTLYFTAGIRKQKHGLFGSITAAK
jgi:uncharacterized protein (TIGR03118 family)